MADWGRVMPERDDQRPAAAAQEATLAREQAGRSSAGLVIRTLKEETGKKPTVTLQDGSVVEADRAVTKWELLKDVQQDEPAAFQSLLTMAEGRDPADADGRHFAALMSRNLVGEDHRIYPVTRDVLLNSIATANGAPMIGALRLRSDADKAVLEEARAQLYQNYSEFSAQSRKPGGWLDQLWEKMEQQRRKGQSLD